MVLSVYIYVLKLQGNSPKFKFKLSYPLVIAMLDDLLLIFWLQEKNNKIKNDQTMDIEPCMDADVFFPNDSCKYIQIQD